MRSDDLNSRACIDSPLKINKVFHFVSITLKFLIFFLLVETIAYEIYFTSETEFKNKLWLIEISYFYFEIFNILQKYFLLIFTLRCPDENEFSLLLSSVIGNDTKFVI